MRQPVATIVPFPLVVVAVVAAAAAITATTRCCLIECKHHFGAREYLTADSKVELINV